MLVDISVGPPVLTINHRGTFMVTDPSGAIAADRELLLTPQARMAPGHEAALVRWSIAR